MASVFSTVYQIHFFVPPFGFWLHFNHRSIQANLPTVDPGAILEIGGGLGRLAQWMGGRYPQARLLSIDVSTDMLAAARARSKRPNVTYEQRDFLDVEGAFDLILSAGSWEFFEREAGSDKIAELLNPGGSFVVNTLQPTRFSRLHARRYERNYGTAIHLHRPAELAHSLEQRGLEVRWEDVNRMEGSYTVVAHRPV